MDVGIVDAAEVSTGEDAPKWHPGHGQVRPDRRAAVRRLIARRQKGLARSVAKAKLSATIAARTVPGPASKAEVHMTKVRYSRPHERRSRAILRLVWAEADRRDDLVHQASVEMLVTETLQLAGLLRNNRIERSLSEAALGRLVAMVRYKAEKLGGLALGRRSFSSRASPMRHAVR